MIDFNPILNNPYEEPKKHYETYTDGSLDYEKVIKKRRPYIPYLSPVPPTKKEQEEMFASSDFESDYSKHHINVVREEISKWRNDYYPNTTRITKELLSYWFLNEERERKLFFSQREAIETAIWFNEVANKTNIGTSILDIIRQGNIVSEDNTGLNLPRIAFKMATGTGKTVVMAMQILYNFLNRKEYKNDIRFADFFLLVTPGITIKERLNVLRVDTSTQNRRYANDYYHILDLVPRKYEDVIPNLNSRIIITNYHALEPRTLKGNKKSPFDGKQKSNGVDSKENYNLVLRRVLGKFKKGSRLLIINDEAHHCYYPKEKVNRNDDDNIKEENQRAAVWFTGLMKISEKYKVDNIYDLSATPYFLKGSGYEAYTLFPWVVSDFGLIESIESGLVKIPFLPESDTTHNIKEPVLRDLYEHVKDKLPKKGKRGAKKAGQEFKGRPRIPELIKNALNQLYSHYVKEDKRYFGMFDSPPVLIVVCNNTNVSSEVFKYIAGYEVTKNDGTHEVVNGAIEPFDNYDKDKKILKKKPPSLLIDSDALENSDQINESFKKIFEPEIEKFKSDYRITHPEKSVENISDADILREVVNTVGKPGLLGQNIRCVVSVSMLTEGWDANTVTHIMGIRAFGSQLLCEQVAGRALRRKSYDVGKDGKFTPEYAHIVGVPFKFFKGGVTVAPPPSKDIEHIFSIPERQEKFEITFPNITGYRIESVEDSIKADFSNVLNYEIDGSKEPAETVMTNAFSPLTEKLTLNQIRKKREQELVYLITKYLISHKYIDDDGNPEFYRFNQLKGIVKYWLDNKVYLIGDAFKNMLFFLNEEGVCESIMKGIYAERKKTDKILPVFNYYNQFGSTKYVQGTTTREVYKTKKSHVNYVVADTKSWEQIAAKTLEELPQVVSYVKNSFLGFAIPYVQEGKENPLYFPDFIARCKVNKKKVINLIIEITGMSKDKAEKKWYVENRWLPSVNAVKDKYGSDEWHFIEISNDIRDIKNQLKNKIKNLV